MQLLGIKRENEMYDARQKPIRLTDVVLAALTVWALTVGVFSI
jgi:hypothetical protein